MHALQRAAIANPRRTIFAALFITSLALPGLFLLQIRTDGHALVPPAAPEILFDREVRQEFGTRDPVVVLIDTHQPDGIYELDVLEALRDLTATIEEIDGLNAHVSSIANEPGDRYQPGTLSYYDLLTPFPRNEEDVQRIKDEISALEVYSGTLVANDGSAAAILVEIPEGTDRTALYSQLAPLMSSTKQFTVRVIGAPFAEALLGNHILQDLGRLLPLSLLIMTLAFYVGFRSKYAMFLPLFQVGGALIFVFGVMAYLKVPLYLTTAVLPIILTCIGVADEIHILKRYLYLLRSKSDPTSATSTSTDASRDDRLIETTMKELTTPVVRTSITTSVGFLAFALSPMIPVRMFGIFAALGIMYCMLWSLIVTPALLSMAPRAWLLGARRSVGVSKFWTNWSLGVRKLRWGILIGAAAVSLLAVIQVGQIRVQDSWIDGFSSKSDFYKATQAFNQHFFGTHVLQVVANTEYQQLTWTIQAEQARDRRIVLPLDDSVNLDYLVGSSIRVIEADPKPNRAWDISGNSSRAWQATIETAQTTESGAGDFVVRWVPQYGDPLFLLRLTGNEKIIVEIQVQRMTKPAVLKRLEALCDFVEGQRQYTVGGVIGAVDYIKTTNFILAHRDPQARSIPDDPNRAPWLLRQYGRVRGAHYLHNTMNDTFSRTVFKVFLKNANYRDTQQLMQSIRIYEQEHLIQHGITLGFAGDVAVSQALIRAIVRTQVLSLILSLLGIFLVSSWLHRSWRDGLYCVLPSAFGILLIFALMGWLNIPLGVATSMFAGMILGIGVDYAIHLLHRFRQQRAPQVKDADAWERPLRLVGSAILLDALAVGLGFGVLIFSQVPANARLGALAAMSIIACLGATLALLPACVRANPPPKRQLTPDST